MSMSAVRPVSCRAPPPPGSNGSDPKTSKATISFSRKCSSSLQMKEESSKPNTLQENLETSSSRREMMNLTAASIGLLFIASPSNAKASPPPSRETFFEDLMRKFGFSKTNKEDENKSSKNEERKPKAEEDKGKKVLEPPKKPKPEDKGAKLESKGEAAAKKNDKVVKNEVEEKKSKADNHKRVEEGGGVKDKSAGVKIEAEEKKVKDDKQKEDVFVGLEDKKPSAA